MVDMEEQKAYLERFLLIKGQRTWYHSDKKRNNWGFKQGQEVSKYVCMYVAHKKNGEENWIEPGNMDSLQSISGFQRWNKVQFTLVGDRNSKEDYREAF